MSSISVKDILSPVCPLQQKFIPNLAELSELSKKLRAAGFRVGVVGGVWDLVHPGHAKYLELAKGECDVLIVVVDTDELVKHRKGPSRPVVPEQERIEMLHYLRSVDIITTRPLAAHTEDTEYLNKAVEPDVCILSTTTGDIPEAKRAEIEKYVKRVKVFPPQAETSSSARIRLLAVDGATPLAKAVTELVDGKSKQISELLAAVPQELQVVIEAHMQRLQSV